MSEERILALHPEAGKSGVNISRKKYDMMREAIVDALAQETHPSFQDLRKAVEVRLESRFEGSIGWHYTTVKLDLEARGIVVRIGTGRPQLLELQRQILGSNK